MDKKTRLNEKHMESATYFGNFYMFFFYAKSLRSKFGYDWSVRTRQTTLSVIYTDNGTEDIDLVARHKIYGLGPIYIETPKSTKMRITFDGYKAISAYNIRKIIYEKVYDIG